MEQILGLHFIDAIIIIFYMIGSLALGSYCSKYVGDTEDFFLAGRALPFWAIGFSIVVSDIGATDFVAVAGAAYRNGISAANFDWMGSMPAMVIAAFIFVPYFWRSGVFTIPEFLGRRYNTGVQFINGLIWVVVQFVMLAVMLWITADKLMYTIIGWDPHYTLWITVIITGIYTFGGGLTAVVFTDVVQLIVMYVGGLGLLALCLWEVGGIAALQEGVLRQGPAFANHFNILLPNDTTGPFPWTGIVFGLGLVMAVAYMSGNQLIVQRTLGARSEWDAKGGMLFGGFLKSFIPLMVALPGLCAVVLLPDLGMDNADRAVPTLIRQLLPSGLRGLMFAALFAALMSHISATLNSVTTITVTDVISLLRKWAGAAPFSSKTSLILGRAITAFFVITTGLSAKKLGNSDQIYVFLQTVLSLFQGPLLAILLLGIMWRRATGWGGLAGLVLGVACCFVLNYTPGLFPSENPFLFVAWWSFVFSIVVTVVVSLLTKREPDEKLRGLVWDSVVADDAAQDALQGRVNS
ncbi:MAG: sodium/solute symporter [Candidatus Hydrogenedentes bacterium]|nr:sodium/solute symporter [Candidatus Hydrogenedentota bacterium]